MPRGKKALPVESSSEEEEFEDDEEDLVDDEDVDLDDEDQDDDVVEDPDDDDQEEDPAPSLPPPLDPYRVPDLDDMFSVFVVGDTHFRKDNFLAQEELIEKCVEAARNVSPSIIILLGDTLDTHETMKNAPWKQATRFIEELSQIAPVYVLIGNHDYINQTQFLTDEHFFNPLKKWPNVVIVDTPMMLTFGDRTIVLCPYTPPGRFVEALDTLGEGWRLADCIFAHQEFYGSPYGSDSSEKGDEWSEDDPVVVSGHIHTPSRIGTNIFYPGSSIQVASNEDPDKRVWLITFDGDPDDLEIKDDGYGILQFDKIDLGLKGKKEIEINYEDLKLFDFALTEQYYIKLKISGTPEQFKVFRKSQMHAKLVRNSVKIGYVPCIEDNPILMALTQGNAELEDELTFETILKELVKHKPLTVQKVYEEVFGGKKEKRYIEIVTERVDDGEEE